MYSYYWLFFGLILVCALFAGSASAKVTRTFQGLSDTTVSSRMTGYDTAARLLVRGGASDIRIGRVQGTLTDHYHPTKGVVNLSESVYGNSSVAAVAVAAHEVGHVMQKKKGYFPYKLRQILVPITNFGSRLALPLVLIGVVLDLFVQLTAYQNLGYYLALVGW